MRSSGISLGGFTMKYMRGTGLWDEDHVNDFNANKYLSARSTMRWYYGMERLQTRNTMNARRATQSHNNNMGLHHSGRGAFERELERRGVPVEKYPLTTTTGASRVAEMVLLRRQELEAQGKEAMESQRQVRRRDAPSKWYDETDGPLNPRFLRSMQSNYAKIITELPPTPITVRRKGRRIMSVGLPYDVLFCTSEDPQHPISELGGCNGIIKPGSSTPAGWQSACHGKTPQTLVIRFQGNVWLQQLRILSHESKIATKVEVRVAKLSQEDDWDNPPSFRSVRFVKLGSVDFNSNEQSHFKSKERKTVHLKTEAYFLKLLFDRPFINAYNTGHQVGIYSLECSGYLIEPILFHADLPSSGATAQQASNATPSPVKQPSPRQPASNSPEDLVAFDGQHANRAWKGEPENGQPVSAFASSPPAPGYGSQRRPTSSRTSQSMVFRSVRILEFEDFFLRRSEELVSLKMEATAVEDYHVAVACRDKLALLNRVAKEIYELEEDKVQAIINEEFEVAQQIKHRMNTLMEQLFVESSLPALGGTTPFEHDDDRAPDVASRPGYDVKHSPSSGHVARIPYTMEVAETEKPRSSLAIEANEEAEKIIDIATLETQEQAIARVILSCANSEEVTSLVLPNPGFDIQPQIAALGVFTVACLLSRHFKLREAALTVLTENIDMFSSPLHTMQGALLRFLDMSGYGIQDPIPNVVFAACRFVCMCLTSSSRRIAELVSPLIALLPRLITRCSDNLQRIRDEAHNTVLLYVKTSSVPSTSILSVALMEPTDKERRNLPLSNAKAQLARLNLLQLLVEHGRLHLDSAGVNSKHVLHKLLLPTVNHPNSEVRDLAVSILVKLVAGRHLAVRDKDLEKIHHAGIRDSIARKR